MRLGGWIRLWIVFAWLWAVPVGLLAYGERPEAGDVERSWVYSGLDAVADVVSEEEGRTVYPHEIRKALEDEYDSNAELIAWFERIEKSPKPHQKTLAKKLSTVNVQFRERLAGLPKASRLHYFYFFLGWAIPLITILGFGFAVGWVRDGFRRGKIQ